MAENFCSIHRVRHGPSGCSLCNRILAQGSRPDWKKAGGIAAGALFLLIALFWLFSFDPGVTTDSQSTPARKTLPTAKPVPTTTIVKDYSKELAALELAYDQLGSLIDSAESEFFSFPETIYEDWQKEAFQEFSNRFEDDFEKYLDLPPFRRDLPVTLRDVRSRLSMTKTQVSRLSYPNGYPSSGARQALIERCREEHREARQALQRAKRELGGGTDGP